MTPQQAKALRVVCDIIMEAVNAAGPMGAPGGHIYAGLMSAGCTFQQYEQLMAGLVRAGKLRKDGECYHAVEKAA